MTLDALIVLNHQYCFAMMSSSANLISIREMRIDLLIPFNISTYIYELELPAWRQHQVKQRKGVIVYWTRCTSYRFMVCYIFWGSIMRLVMKLKLKWRKKRSFF
ncbi:hypothetical protein P3L10_003103 [Capsicum annuum]